MSHGRAVALMVLVTLLWSIAGVVTRHLDAARSFEVTFWRSLFNAIALLAILAVMRGAGLWRTFAAGGRLLWISGISWGIMYTAFMIALTLTSVANVLVTMAVGPLITALFSRIFLAHRLPARTWLAILAAAAGIAWMFGEEAARGVSLLGSLVALAVPLAAAVNWTLLQQLASRARDSGEAAPDMLPAILLGALLSAAATLPLAWPLQASGHDIGLLSLLGAVQLAIPCLLVVRVAQHLPSHEVALLALLEVIFGVALAWIGAGEQPAVSTVYGGLLVLGALVGNELAGRRERLNSPAERPAVL
jgi:drug/metabolite transporter (DMT)-like permease